MSIDYGVFIEDLQAQRNELMARVKAIDDAIQGAKLLAGYAIAVNPQRNDPPSLPTRKSDLLVGLNTPSAAELVLRKVGRVMRTKELSEAMLAEGFETTAKHFSTTLGSILIRHSKEVGRVVRMKGGWGLREWEHGQQQDLSAA